MREREGEGIMEFFHRGNGLRNAIGQGGRIFRRAAFTIVELLTVVAVIAILACMLLSLLTHVKNRGREVACASYQRQAYMAAVLYASDNGRLFSAK